VASAQYWPTGQLVAADSADSADRIGENHHANDQLKNLRTPRTCRENIESNGLLGSTDLELQKHQLDFDP